MKRQSDDLLARSERLSRLQDILHRVGPAGSTARQLAAQFGDADVVLRTIQRDLQYLRELLEDEPWFDGSLLGPPRGPYSLPAGVYPYAPIQLSLHEARALLFGMRLLVHNTGGRDHDALTVLQKLAASFPGSVAQQAELLRELFDSRAATREDRDHLRILHDVTDAWARSQTVELRYVAPGKNPRTIKFDPYLLTPGGANAATYLTGFSHLHNEVRTLVLSRIVRVTRTTQRFTPPELAELAARMERSFGGVILGDEEHRVILDFSPAAAVRAAESHPVPGRTVEQTANGGLRMEMTLPSLLDFLPWVLGWGPDVRVVEPPELRERVIESLKRASANYD